MSDTAGIDAGFRLRRLLAVLSYLAEVGQARIDDLAERFSMDRSSLIADLELAACCGLPPYTPDQLLELVVDDEQVSAYGLDALRRPPRLTPHEGFLLAASARALLAVPGVDSSGPLGRALAKLESALGDTRVSVELDQPESLAELRLAAASGDVIEIDYLGAARGEQTTRVVEPYTVVAREGHFYLDAYCHLASDWRRFALDRILDVRPTTIAGEARTPPAEFFGSRAFAGGPSVSVATVELPAARKIAVERVAIAEREVGEGRIAVDLEVGDRDWFGRLLLRIGADATVLEPTELIDAGRDVAKKALTRYRKADKR